MRIQVPYHSRTWALYVELGWVTLYVERGIATLTQRTK